jgi:hypothetical protein
VIGRHGIRSRTNVFAHVIPDQIFYDQIAVVQLCVLVVTSLGIFGIRNGPLDHHIRCVGSAEQMYILTQILENGVGSHRNVHVRIFYSDRVEEEGHEKSKKKQ